MAQRQSPIERGNVSTSRSHLRSEAGAVNAMWLIIIMILWLGTLFLLYVTNSDIARTQDAERAALEEKAIIDAKFTDLNADYLALSESVGFRDSAAGAKSDLVSVGTQLETVKTALGSVVGDGDVTLESAISSLLADRQSAWTQATQAKAALETERTARQAAETNVSNIESNYTAQIDQLQRDLSEAQDAADTQAANDQGRIDDITAENTSLDAEKRTAERELTDTQEAGRKREAELNSLVGSLAHARAPIAPEQPDGSLVEVSDSGAVGWIDVGGKDGLLAGTRFELLRRGKTGELVPRGKVEVREVMADMAMVGLVGKANVYDPMLPGDLIRNPHFSKDRTWHFYLLGDFPLSMSKEFVTGRLKELGAVVDDELSARSDVIVLGQEALTEDGGPALTETDEYRKASELGLRVVRLAELSTFLRY